LVREIYDVVVTMSAMQLVINKRAIRGNNKMNSCVEGKSVDRQLFVEIMFNGSELTSKFAVAYPSDSYELFVGVRSIVRNHTSEISCKM
jgi:hypothetical protein